MIKVTAIVESPIGGFDAYVETKKGKRYFVNWGSKPTEKEVLEAWKEDRKWFAHIN
ncbi:hypothetical protein [Paenibacillus glucanolyticus]|uniref:hypothetical protein n=1 Tax=Paenibacillus glucanolyticus TaxID=59843 RepID=UPI0015C3FFEB|nr:hypothetical protein [Paenibacillus glucanolyticus]